MIFYNFPTLNLQIKKEIQTLLNDKRRLFVG